MYVSIAQANLPNMYLEYSPISCWFFSPQLAFAPEAFVHLYAAAKNVLFGVQSNKKIGPFGDPASFWCWHQTHCENFTYLFVRKHVIIYMEEIWKSEEFAWDMRRIFKKNEKHIWKNAEFDWTSERISMEKWRIRLDKRKNLYGPTVF